MIPKIVVFLPAVVKTVFSIWDYFCPGFVSGAAASGGSVEGESRRSGLVGRSQREQSVHGSEPPGPEQAVLGGSGNTGRGLRQAQRPPAASRRVPESPAEGARVSQVSSCDFSGLTFIAHDTVPLLPQGAQRELHFSTREGDIFTFLLIDEIGNMATRQHPNQHTKPQGVKYKPASSTIHVREYPTHKYKHETREHRKKASLS